MSNFLVGSMQESYGAHVERKQYQLTKFPIGSMQESWAISWPLMLGLVSGSLMLFFDRLFLANHSVNDMNAVASAGMAAYAFLMLPIITASISEVFVGQHHGKGENDQMLSAVWQMVWFSIFCIPYFLAIAFFGPSLIFGFGENSKLKSEFFSIVMSGGLFFTLSTALMGYFSGQGHTKLILIATIIANGLNICLDYFLINDFGYAFTGLGIRGAAIATVSAQFFQVVFFAFFLARSNKKWKKSENWVLVPKKIIASLKIGAPSGLAHTNEMVVHFLFFSILESRGSEYLTIIVTIQSLYMALTFIGEGLSKGVTAIVSNLIGAGQLEQIGNSVASAIKIVVLAAIILLVVLSIGYFNIFNLFFNAEDRILLNSPQFNHQLYLATICMVLYFLVDGIVWVFMGLLTATGDTTYIMIINFGTYWITYLLAVYIGVHYFDLSVSGTWLLVVLNSCVILALLALRSLKKPWQRAALV